MPFDITGGSFLELIHAIVVGGIVAVRYLWPVWLIIGALWLVTRGLRAVGGFFGFSGSRRDRKPARGR